MPVPALIVAIDLIAKLAGPETTLIAGHGTNIKKPELLPYRAMIVDIRAKTKQLVDQGKSLQDVLAANLTAPYDATTKGDTPAEQDAFHHRGLQRGEGDQVAAGPRLSGSRGATRRV